MHRFLVSAAHKSSGKTTVSVGLAAELTRRGLAVQAFKKGPDYIDPMWLTAATGRSCRNLDFNLSTPGELQLEFARHGALADVCLVEGNKGLYDGLDLHGNNSNAALAQLLDLPVVLVLDARGMTRGIAPLILGYQAFDRSIRIAGVILSRLGGPRHEAKLRAVIEHYTDVPVLGAMHEDPSLAIAERHIGLTPTNEDGAVQTRIALLARAVGTQVDLDRLLAAATVVTWSPRWPTAGLENPLLLRDVAPSVVHHGGFHAVHLTAALDDAALALGRAAVGSINRLALLTEPPPGADPANPGGPEPELGRPFLAGGPVTASGIMVLEYGRRRPRRRPRGRVPGCHPDRRAVPRHRAGRRDGACLRCRRGTSDKT